jgi:hypothetical protein
MPGTVVKCFMWVIILSLEYFTIEEVLVQILVCIKNEIPESQYNF